MNAVLDLLRAAGDGARTAYDIAAAALFLLTVQAMAK